MSRILDAALHLFSHQGYRATAMRDIAKRAGLSTGNVYHHFGSKEVLFERLMERYWEKLGDPALPLNRLFAKARFPDDLEQLADLIEEVVEDHIPYILLIYVDVIEFQGKHIHDFYADMYDRFAKVYGPSLDQGRQEGRFGEDVDLLLAVMVAVRWFFYYYTVEKAFGVPLHLGMDSARVKEGFVKILQYGVLNRDRDPSSKAGSKQETS
jgi:AcrR family transcriptional regulator